MEESLDIAFERVSEWIKENKEIFKPESRPSAFTCWAACVDLAKRHTRGASPGMLLTERRPGEDHHITEWREKVYKPITKEPTEKAISLLTRTLLGVNAPLIDISEITREHYEGKNISLLGERMTFDEYMAVCLFREMVEDPNAVLFQFPTNNVNPLLPPSVKGVEGASDRGRPIDIKQKLVRSEQLRTSPDSDIVVWSAGMMEYEYTGAQGTKTAQDEYFYIVDATAYYWKYPTGKDGKGKTNYSLDVWFHHDTGYVPVNILGGNLTKDEEKGNYFESFLDSFYQIADLAILYFSDKQAVDVQHAHPRQIVMPTKCSNMRCNGGIVVNMDMATKHKKPHLTCNTCKGTGTLTHDHPFDRIQREPLAGGLNKQGVVVDPISYAPFPQSNLDYIGKEYRYFIEAARKSIYVDVLENPGESGEALKTRRLPLLDQLLKWGNRMFLIKERALRHGEALLIPNANDRKKPKITRPKKYELKTTEDVYLELEKAPEADKRNRMVSYMQHTYSNDPVRLKQGICKLDFAPFTYISEEMKKHCLEVGSDEDFNKELIKAKRADIILDDILDDWKEEKFMAATKKDIRNEMAERIEEYYPEPQTLAIRDASGELAPNGRQES